MRINIENDFRYHARTKNRDWVIQSNPIQADSIRSVRKPAIGIEQTTGLNVAKNIIYNDSNPKTLTGNTHLSHLILSHSLHLSHLIAISELAL